jgi:hypothetical protein
MRFNDSIEWVNFVHNKIFTIKAILSDSLQRYDVIETDFRIDDSDILCNIKDLKLKKLNEIL